MGDQFAPLYRVRMTSTAVIFAYYKCKYMKYSRVYEMDCNRNAHQNSKQFYVASYDHIQIIVIEFN